MDAVRTYTGTPLNALPCPVVLLEDTFLFQCLHQFFYSHECNQAKYSEYESYVFHNISISYLNSNSYGRLL